MGGNRWPPPSTPPGHEATTAGWSSESSPAGKRVLTKLVSPSRTGSASPQLDTCRRETHRGWPPPGPRRQLQSRVGAYPGGRSGTCSPQTVCCVRRPPRARLRADRTSSQAHGKSGLMVPPDSDPMGTRSKRPAAARPRSPVSWRPGQAARSVTMSPPNHSSPDRRRAGHKGQSRVEARLRTAKIAPLHRGECTAGGRVSGPPPCAARAGRGGWRTG